jgi:hypothetical protein
MAEPDLGTERIEGGRRLLGFLLGHDVSLEAAFWVLNEQLGEWRLVVVTPAVSKGIKPLILLSRRILAYTNEAAFDEFDINFEATDEPLYMALRASKIHIVGSYIGGRSVFHAPDSTLIVSAFYMYFSSAEELPEAAIEVEHMPEAIRKARV